MGMTYTVHRNLGGKKLRIEGGVLFRANSMCMGMQGIRLTCIVFVVNL